MSWLSYIRRWHLGEAAGAVVVGVLVAVSGWVDVDRFFNKQMHDASVYAEYSTSPTYVAKEALKMSPDTRFYIDERIMGEPTITFLAPQIKDRSQPYRISALPLTTDAPTVLFAGGDQE